MLGLCLALSAIAQPGMHVRSDGNVGINMTDPQSTLVIYGSPPTLRFGIHQGDPSESAGMLIFDKVLAPDSDDMTFCGMALKYNTASDALELLSGCSPDPIQTVMTIDQGGHVGIGTVPDTFMLQVAGSVRSEEIIVETGWADYVFEEEYYLRPLSDVEQFILERGHLPDIPSATTVQQEGLHVGTMTTRMMQKIEELTLYTIDQQEQIEEQSQRIQEQNQEIEELRALVAKIYDILDKVED